jgi:hypothetical protein
VAGTPNNYAKTLEDWFTKEFIPACAAYAVFYDFSDWNKLYTKQKGVDWEGALNIKDGELTNKGTYEAYKKVQKAAAEVGMKRSSGEGAQLISKAVSEAEAYAKSKPERSDAEVQQDHDAKIAALGNNPNPAAVDRMREQAEATKAIEKFSAQGTAFFERLKDDPRMLGPVLDAILKLQDDGGFAGLLWALWAMTRKFKFSYTSEAGLKSWDKGTKISSDAVKFNILVSTIIRNPEDPKLGYHDKDTTSQLRWSELGLDAMGKGPPIMETFGPLFKPKPTSWVPLCYTEPWFGGVLGQGGGAQSARMAFLTDKYDLRPGEAIETQTFDLDEPPAYFQRYMMRVIHARPPAPGMRQSATDLWVDAKSAPRREPWKSVESFFKGGPGAPRRHAPARSGGRNESAVEGKWTGEVTPAWGGEAWVLQGGAIFYYFQQMILEIGRDARTKAPSKPRRQWYNATIAEILGGAAPKKKRRRGGGRRRRKSKPKNEGKRELKKGEINVINFQCVLLENIKELARIRGASRYKTLGEIDGVMPGSVVSKLNHGSEGIGKKSSWPPTTGGPDGEAYAMQNMCPDIWALMTPHIELFRVSYSGSAGLKQTPVEEHQIPFSNFIDQSNIVEITKSTYGRQGGAGIKSFTWTLDGTQPAEVDNMITANLVMHFQSVYDLFRHNEIPGNPGQYAAGIPAQPGYLDLIIGSGVQGRPANPQGPEQEPAKGVAPCEGLVSQQYKGDNFRIKAIVGWSTPPNFTDMEIPGYSGGVMGDLASIQSAIEGSRKALYLQITSHQINFQQDGTLELSINYQASISGIMRTPRSDIFVGKELYGAEMEALNQELAELVETEYDTAAEDTTREKKRAELLDKQMQLMRKARKAKHTVFLKALRDKNKIRGISVDTKELLKGGFAKMTPEERAEAAKIRAGKALREALAGSVAAETAAQEKELDAFAAGYAGAKGDPAENEDLKRMADNLGIFNTKKSKTTTIPFFYLGDLIDVVMGERLSHLTEKDGSGASPLQMMLGPVELIDPLQAFQIKTVTFACPDATTEQKMVQLQLAKIDPCRFRMISGIFTTMNIGSIPISTHAFDEWFVNTVVRGNKDSYFLLNFIKDVCGGLVSRAYGSSCYKDLFQYNIKFDTATFRMADDFKGQSKTINELGRSARSAAERDRHRLTADPDSPPPSIPTVVLYPVQSRPSVGDRASDMQDGIYHYFLGGRCGLAKEINFTRQDMPFYREARIDKDGSLGAQQLKELYTVQLNMIGNTLHKNGTYIYIDPIAIGAGSASAIGGVKNIARLIGLGGYFLVNSVSNELTPSSYNTTVGAMQEMSAMDEGTGEKLVAINGPALDSSDPANSDSPEAAAAGDAGSTGTEAGDITGDASGTVTAPAEGEETAAAEGEEGATPDATTEEQAAAQLARSQEQAAVAAAAVASAEDALRAATIAARDSRRALIADLESRGMSTESLGQTDEERAVADLVDTLQELIGRRDQLNRRIDRATSS